MTKPYATRRLERTVDGVRISAVGALVTREGTVPGTRSERRYRQEWRTVYDEHETRHYDRMDDGTERYSHSTFERVPREEYYDEPYDVNVPCLDPVYDVRADDGQTYVDVRRLDDAVREGDSLVLLNYVHLATGRKWVRWLNASTRLWQKAGTRPFPITPAVSDAANRLRRQIEFDARRTLAGRAALMRPMAMTGGMLLLEGVVLETADGHAIVDFAGTGRRHVEVAADYAIAPGDLMQILALAGGDRIHAVHVMTNPATWSLRMNEKAILGVRGSRSTGRQQATAAGGLMAMAGGLTGFVLSWSPISAWLLLGVGMAAGLKAAIDRKRDDAAAMREDERIRQARDVVERALNTLAAWNWKRIREGF